MWCCEAGGGGGDLESAVVFSVCFVVLFLGWGANTGRNILYIPTTHHPQKRDKEREKHTDTERETDKQSDRKRERLTCK